MCDKPEIIHPRVYQKYLKMYQDDEKDIKFVFEESDTEIRAHKLVLKTVSPVLAGMFNGSFSEKDTALIRGIKPQIFQKLIDVIYMQPVRVSSLDEAVDICNVAEMYDVEDLKDIASDFLLENNSYKNRFYMYEKAIQFNLPSVADKCREFLRDCFENCLSVSGLLLHEYDIDEDIFLEFLTINEYPDSALYTVLEFFVISGKLKTYKKALKEIRFLTMSFDEIILASLLTDTEKLAIIYNMVVNKKESEPILPMPEHLSSNATLRREKPPNSDYYKYFWIKVLLISPVGHFADHFKRMSTLDLFSTEDLEHLKKEFESHLSGKSFGINDLQPVDSYVSKSGLKKIFSIFNWD